MMDFEESDGTQTEVISVDEDTAIRQGIELIAMFRRLPLEERSKVLSLARLLSGQIGIVP